MSYLLDTNAVIALMKQHPQMLQFVRRVGLPQLLLCAPVEAELWFGVYKSARPEENRLRLLNLLALASQSTFLW
jgi:tRNA(fMet)-specific endonuclease VapC